MENTTVSPTSKHRTKRTLFQRTNDLVLIESLALRGHTQEEIARQLSSQRGYTLSRQMITYDLEKLRRLWVASAVESYGEARAIELRRLGVLEGELWVQWERSKKEADGGDPAFSAQILGVHDRRARILGLAAPQRTEITGAAGGAVQIESTEPLAPLGPKARLEILKRHIARLEEAEAVTSTGDEVSVVEVK